MKRWLITLLLGTSMCAWSATYYIDYTGGVNTNNGTSKTTAWKHAPSMNGFTGSYTHRAGDRFIFKGGVTWDHTCFEMDFAAGGSSAAWDYYGVDSTWYTGSAWKRPIFSGDHTHLARGSNIIYIGYAQNSYIIIDNIEIKSHRSYANWGPGSIGVYCVQYVLLTNLWVHDWSLDPGLTSDDTHGGIIGNFPSCSSLGAWVDHCEISNVEAADAGRQNGGATRAINVRFSKIHDVSAGMLGGDSLHDCEFYNVGYPAKNTGFDPVFHTNVAYPMPGGGGAMYNNIIHDVQTGSGGMYPSSSCNTMYIYNNVVWNNYWNSDLAIETEWGSANCGATYVYNNTFQVQAGGFTPIRVVGRGFSYGTLVIQNNHFIYDGTGYLDTGSGVQNLTNNHNLEQTNAQAATQGYVIANRFAPTSGTGSTVNAGGVNLAGTVAKDIKGVPRPQGASWDMGAYEYITTEVRPPMTENRKSNQYQDMLYPNPIQATLLYQYRQIKKDMVLYDMAGKVVSPESIEHNGVYLVREGKNAVCQKIVVIE